VTLSFTVTPAFPNNTIKRNLQVSTVAREIARNNVPAILVGDLNVVPWAQDFQSIKTISGMTESRKGFLATYPMDFGIPLIPIDHILHSKHFSTAFCTTVVLPGSDHKGLIAGLNWN
jgi:endonuclease/exonuclease/phosphatase (EEP) superfamily protein YafD